MHRILTGLGVGSVIAFVLFAIMSLLIKSDLKVPAESSTPAIVINTIPEETEIEEKIRTPPEPPEVLKEPPPVETIADSDPDKPQLKDIDIKLAAIEPGLVGGEYVSGHGKRGGMSDGDAVPMVVIQPNYPRKALTEGIEGWVKFKFTIAPDGTPKNIELVEAKPRRIFETAAKKAIYKWKFKPRIIDGKAVEQTNMTYTLNFRLSEE